MRTLLLLLLGIANLSAADIAWRATLSSSSGNLFSLASADGQQAAWLGLGDTFSGYRLIELSADGKSLLLEKEGQRIELQLAGSRIQEAPTTDLAAAEELLRVVKFEEMLAHIIETQKQSMRDLGRQMAAQLGLPQAEGSAQQLLERVQDLMLSEIYDERFAADLAKVYAEELAPAELRALTNFYSTDAGRAFIDKQPALMERSMQMIQPRLMAAMQKIQVMVAEEAAKSSLPAPPSERPEN